MYGTVQNNELKAIAGLSDGTTSIVHRATDTNYAIPLAVDNQYGAGYVGISDCCKFLFNPLTGIAIVDCMDTTTTCVDINTNSNTCEQQRLLAQGFDNEGNLDNKIELTNVCYNANCYVCNDASGNPVRKPVLHIGTACIDELLGIEQGATVKCWCCGTNTNEGNILFTCDDGTGTTIYYATDLNYNANTRLLVSEHMATRRISPYDYNNTNEAYVLLNKEYVTIGGNSRDNSASFLKISCGCVCINGVGCPAWIGNSNANVNFAANGNTSINAPSLSMSATCTYMSLPNALTCVNLVARDHASGQMVEVPEVVYNPSTCELCGKFVPTGGIAVCPTSTSAWYNIVINCDTADGLKYSDVAHRIAADPDTGRIFASGGLTSDGGVAARVEYGNELNIYTTDGRTDSWINYRGGASELKIGNGNAASGAYGNVYANRAIADLQGRILMDCGYCASNCSFMPYSGTSGVYGIKEGDWGHFLTFSHGNFDTYYGTAVHVPFWDRDRWYWRTRANGELGGIHALLDDRGGQRVYGDFYLGCNNYYVQRDGVDQPVALACDVAGAGMNWLDGTYGSWSSLMGNIPTGRATYGIFNFSPAVSIYDTTTGKTFTTDEIVGTFYRPNASGMFTGITCLVGSASGVRNLTFWFADNNGPNSGWTSIAPIPGTLYGSASSSGINVMGTV